MLASDQSWRGNNKPGQATNGVSLTVISPEVSRDQPIRRRELRCYLLNQSEAEGTGGNLGNLYHGCSTLNFQSSETESALSVRYLVLNILYEDFMVKTLHINIQNTYF